MTKLTDKKVAGIKQRLTDKVPQPVIARKYHVGRSVISDIATGRVHKDVPWPEGEPPVPKQAGGQHKPIADYDPTDEKVLELEAEVVHLTEERNRERQKVKAGAKIAGLFKAITTEMEADQALRGPAAGTGLPPQGTRFRALRHAHERWPPRSGRAARRSRRPGRLQLPDFLRPRRAATWTP